MARRKQNPFEDIMELTSKVPWWVGASLAAVSFLILHALDAAPVPKPTRGINGTFLFKLLAPCFGMPTLAAETICYFYPLSLDRQMPWV